jgi:hypothetical protein
MVLSPKEGLECEAKRKTAERKLELSGNSKVGLILHRRKNGIMLDKCL